MFVVADLAYDDVIRVLDEEDKLFASWMAQVKVHNAFRLKELISTG